jgi:hypothetical protein
LKSPVCGANDHAAMREHFRSLRIGTILAKNQKGEGHAVVSTW